MRHLKKLFPFLVLVFVITHCNDITSTTDADLYLEGKITYMEIEGGFWAVRTDDETYEPANLPTEFQEEGLEVAIAANIEEDKVSYRMVGPIIHIVEIEKR